MEEPNAHIFEFALSGNAWETDLILQQPHWDQLGHLSNLLIFNGSFGNLHAS